MEARAELLWHQGAVQPRWLSITKCFTLGSMNLSTALKRPTAFLPLAMSLAALALVLGHTAIYGVVHEVDEGTPAHLFQLLPLGIAYVHVQHQLLPPARQRAARSVPHFGLRA